MELDVFTRLEQEQFALEEKINKLERFMISDDFKSFRFYPEDICRLTYVQKYLERKNRKDISYKDYINANFKK